MTCDCRDKRARDEGKHPCLICTDYRQCPLTEKEKESFEYWQIRWCSQQNFWLLKYAELIHKGQWPVADATAPEGMSGKVLTEAASAKASLPPCVEGVLKSLEMAAFAYPARASNSGSTAFYKRAVSYEGLLQSYDSGERPFFYFRHYYEGRRLYEVSLTH